MRHLLIVLLFSIPGTHGRVPRIPPPPHTPYYQCVKTSDPRLTECCVWDPHAIEGVLGGWDCTTVVNFKRREVK